MLFMAAAIWSGSAAAQQGQGVSVEAGGGGISDGFLTGMHFFFFQDESTLGGTQLNDGSSVFTRMDFQYNISDWFTGFGLSYESHEFGEDQTDTVTGALIEFFVGNLFFKYIYGFNVQQEFKNRSFSTRSGTSSSLELGIRAPLAFGISFYEFALHQRTVTIKSEDGAAMDSEFTLSQTMPMLAVGVTL